ncbi:ADP-ribosylglycohydrolase family protein [Nocardia stercoris]|uniref:ADP-ribosylglycohydrolase family protein n=1 Tax=Nocardia stercoris TaxID=2483361 RepID=A0A3M2LE36_9NOCA|nr:ADP-ribosylglycohydrolase family protein [Nocardia stercoris]RMI34863.1 ADP-ribosylglycohydrolase family protein [Nocardia stercoris]
MQANETLSDRIRGALVGGAIGDALGWPIEFLQLEQIRARYGFAGVTDLLPQHDPGPQHITDDTQMTMFTAEGLLRTPVGADPVPVLRRAYLRWLDTQQNDGPATHPDGWLAGLDYLYAMRSPGNACITGLRRQAREYQPPRPLGEHGAVNSDSKGCGTVMRSAPFGLVGAGPEVAFGLAARAAQLTHGHPTGYVAAGAFAALIDESVSGRPLRDAVRDTITRIDCVPGSGEVGAALRWAVESADAAGTATAAWVEQVGAGWVAEECLAVAVFCALHAEHTGDVRGALLLSVNHSGDSDSTGAVTGNLLGARHGLSALPPDWAAAVEGRADLITLADDLVAACFHDDRSGLGDRYPIDSRV